MIITTGTYFIIDANVADTLGIHEAFVLARIDYWLSLYQSKRSKYEKDHFMNGRWWTYETVDDLTEQIKWCSKRSVQNAIKNLKDSGIIIVDHFSKKINWYTIDYKILMDMVRKEHPEIDELNDNNDTIDSANCAQDSANNALNSANCASNSANRAPSSNTYNNIYINNTKNTSNISLIYIKDPAEKEKICQMFDKVIKNDLIANYPIHTNLEVVEIMIRNRVGDCHSFDEAEQLLGAIWHGVNIYKSEYASKHKDEDENVDYTYLPNLRKLYTTELANETNYFFREGLKKHRQFMYNKYGKEYGGDANAG
jgi:DNA-binding Lrp family transcriptional regulator